MKTLTKFALLLIAGIIWNTKFESWNAFANKLTLQNIVVDQAAGTVQFQIGWENSWRLAVATTAPYNYDAAWVFVKFRDCTADPATTQFTHALVSTTLTDHNWDVPGDGQIFEASKQDGTAGIDAVPNNTGVMLRQVAIGGASLTVSETIRLKFTNIPTSVTLDLRVFGIEMVYIPGAGSGLAISPNFTIGDGDGTQYSTNSWNSPGCNCSYTYITVSTESNTSIYYNCCSGYTVSTNIGYNPFFIMKYEITQGQFADFLNSVSDNQATILFPGNYNSNRNRLNNVGAAPQKYSSDRADRAQNYLSWIAVTSYLDWACLKPLTELQFEKAARGFATRVPYECAWGTQTITKSLTISGTEDGTETVTTPNANVSAANTTFTGGDAGTGPLRAGIYATPSTSTRQATGAGYFGVMEMSGNVSEFYRSAVGGFSTISLGDGILDPTTAYHNVANWPSASAPSTNIIRRGGNWNNGSTTAGPNNPLNISYRNEGTTATADMGMGGRGGR